MNLSKALSRITALALAVMLLLTQTGITAYAEEGAEPPEQTETVSDNAEGGGLSDNADSGPVSGPASSPPALGYSTIVAFAPLDEEVAEQAVVAGTAPEDLALPETLAATVENGDGEQAQADIPVEGWSAEPEYDPLVPGTYLFTPELPEGYTLEDGVEPPEITVQVFMGFAPMALTVPVSSYVQLDTALSNYASETDDVEIILAANFPIDSLDVQGITGFAVPGNAFGHTLTIRSANSGSPASITRESTVTGTLFEVSSGAHLILEDVVLDGNNVAANNSLVYVNVGGSFTMRAGAVIHSRLCSPPAYGRRTPPAMGLSSRGTRRRAICATSPAPMTTSPGFPSAHRCGGPPPAANGALPTKRIPTKGLSPCPFRI